MCNLDELSANSPGKQFSGVIMKIDKRYIFYTGRTLSDTQEIKEKFEKVYRIIFEPLEEITGTPEEIIKRINFLNERVALSSISFEKLPGS